MSQHRLDIDDVDVERVLRAITSEMTFSALVVYGYLRWREFVRWADNVPGFDEPFWEKPVFEALLAFSDRRKHLELIVKVSRKYRRLYRLMFGPIPKIFVNDPELFKQVWTSPKALKKPHFYRFFGWGAGLVTASVESWKVHRKILNPAFGLSALQSFIPIFDGVSRELVSLLEPHTHDGKAFDLFEFVVNTTLDSICATSFGVKVNAQRRRLDFNKYLQRVHEIISMRIANYHLYSDTIFACTPFYFEDKYVRRKCITFGDKLIKQRKEVLKAAEAGVEWKDQGDGKEIYENITNDPKSEKPQIFVDYLLKQDSGTRFTDEDIRGHVFTTISAGNETTALGLCSAVLFLAVHPEVQDRAVEELLQVFPDKNAPMEQDALNKLTYMDMILKETLRLCPAIHTVGRELQDDIVLDGHRIPKGTEIICSIYSLQRREEDWGPDSELFNPDNFLPENVASRHPFSYVPFSGGSRNCIGKKYGMMSMKVMLCHLLMNYKFSSPLKYADIKWQLDVHLHMVNPHLVSIEPRNFANNNLK